MGFKMGMMIAPSRFGAVGGGGAGAYRYVRFTFTSGDNVVLIREVAAFADLLSTTNLFLGKTATANSVNGGFPASNAVDGNLSTFFASSNTTSTPALTIDAGVGQTFAAAVFAVTASIQNGGVETPYSVKVEGSNDLATWTTLVGTLSINGGTGWARNEQRRFTGITADDASGYRYLWVKNTGTNFAGNTVAYDREFRFIGAAGENIALENIGFVGTKSANACAVFFGDDMDATTNGGASVGVAIGDSVGVDLGRKRLKPASIAVDHSTDSFWAGEGFKQFEVYGSNTNNIATATLLLAVNDTSGTPAASATRTYAIL